jgi:short-subunit dehydrogenase
VIAADLQKESDLVRVEKVLATNRAVRVLVNSAGLGRLGPIAQSPVEESLAQIALNITSVTRLTHAVLPALLSRNDGVIVNIASVLAIHSLPISSVYSGTKAFVLNFSRGLQDELAETGVKVQVVLPATIATEIWDASGVPLSALDPDTVMTAENMVDAALAGFDQGEAITWPSVADTSLWDKYDAARSTLFAATQTGKPAARYNAA